MFVVSLMVFNNEFVILSTGGYLEISQTELLSDVTIPHWSSLSVITVTDASFLLSNRSVAAISNVL